MGELLTLIEGPLELGDGSLIKVHDDKIEVALGHVAFCATARSAGDYQGSQALWPSASSWELHGQHSASKRLVQDRSIGLGAMLDL